MFNLLFISIFVLALLACSKRDDEMAIKNEMCILMEPSGDVNVKKIKVLAKDVNKETSITVIWDLNYSESFLELEKYSYQILANIVELLEDDELNGDDKFVLAYAMQNVEFKYLKYYLRDIAISYKNGKIDEDIVGHCFFPEDDWNYVVIQYYKDPIIRESLKICLSNNKIDPFFKEEIRVVLKGKAWRIVKKRVVQE
jgi:hypothetical protein